MGGKGKHVGSLAGRLIGKHGGAGWRQADSEAGVHVSRRPTGMLREGAGREAGIEGTYGAICPQALVHACAHPRTICAHPVQYMILDNII